ncbi:MAG: hypothetical protein AAFY16_00320 [Cyanobacteria bacterium J06642_3]
MSDKEIHIHTQTGADGMLHLDIPVGIVNENLEVTVSYSTLKRDDTADAELAEILANAKPASDLSESCGTITLTEDPLIFQQNIRNEW